MSEKSTHTVAGSEMVVRKVAKSGGGAHVYVPKDWVGENVTVIRSDG